MKNPKSPPISWQTFPEYWGYVDDLRRSARIKSAIGNIGGALSNFLFYFLLLFAGNGLIYDHFSGSYHQFLGTIPEFLNLWEPVSRLLLKQESPLYVSGIKLLLACYLLSALAFCLLALTVRVFYHPLRRIPPTGELQEQADALLALSQEAYRYGCRTHITTSAVSVVLAVAAAFILYFAYAFHLNDAAAIEGYLSKFPTSDAATNALIYVLFAFLLLHLLGSVLIFLTRFLYRMDIPYALQVKAETFALFAVDRELEEAMTEEEVFTRRSHMGARLWEEGMTQEENNAYRAAKECFRKGALCGDAAAMEHYARHCLIAHVKAPARYWLERCVTGPEASRNAKRMYRRLKWGLDPKVNFLGTEKAKQGGFLKKLLSTAAMLLLTCSMVLVCYGFYDSYRNPGKYQQYFTQVTYWLTNTKNKLTGEEAEEIAIEEVSPFLLPDMEFTEIGTRWEGGCVKYAADGRPVISCYGKDMGGDLYAPYLLEEDCFLRTAWLYTGNQWSMPIITEYVTYDPTLGCLKVAEEYLMTLEPGEYFIALDPVNKVYSSVGAHYIPLIVSDSTTFNSTQRGFAAMGNGSGSLINDLSAPEDITLPFYNMGDNPIRAVRKVSSNAMSPFPLDSQVGQEFYTISPAGNAVTISGDYFAQESVGSYMEFKVVLANGETLTMDGMHILTVNGEDTGLLTLQGEETYSRYKGGDLVIAYDMGCASTIHHLSLRLNGTEIVSESDLSTLQSSFIDFDSRTVTIPQEVFAQGLQVGDRLDLFLSYATVYNQFHTASIHMEVVY